MKRTQLIVFLCFFVVLPTFSLYAKPPKSSANEAMPQIKLSNWTLNNGLKVVYAKHSAIPVVTVQVWYHVGSKNEHRGIRGVAHMFEHLMFKGTTHVRPEEHARMLTAVGGSVNAFTANDVTAYHDTLPKDYLDFALKLEAERMQNLLLTQKNLVSERNVVKEEKRQRIENSPIGRSLEAIHDLAYTKHSYAWTPAGDIGDLNKTTMKTYQDFYKTYYAPNNATLIVVGDVELDAVKKSVNAYFSKIPKGKKPPALTIKEPKQKKTRIKVGDWPSQFNVILGAYHIPEAKHDDIAALAVLSSILSSGRSSRLYRSLVRQKKLAIAAGGFVRELEDPGLFYIWAMGLPNIDINNLYQELISQIKNVKEKGVSKKELKKAKNQLALAQLKPLQTANGLANQIGESMYIYGNPKAFLSFVKEIDSVELKDIKRVANLYLNLENFSVVKLPSTQGTRAKRKKAGQ